jgi:3-dehydroquinate dehydratase-1
MSGIPSKSRVVGVIASENDLEAVLGEAGKLIDLCELRIDILEPCPARMRELASTLAIPRVVTVRDPVEGGLNRLSEARRYELFEEWFGLSNYIDLELRNLGRFCRLAGRAENAGIQIIVSLHDFDKTPSLQELETALDKSRGDRQRIFKIACKVTCWDDVKVLSEILEKHRETPIAVMGMGPLGKLSRILFAGFGSELAYVSVGNSVASGQWPADKFRLLLSELERR